MNTLTTIRAINATNVETKLIPDHVGLDILISGKDVKVSDGYHTFEELYDHRITLFIALCGSISAMDVVSERMGMKTRISTWRSKLHSDGSAYDGWFIMGIGKVPGQQISYHLPLSRWEETSFVETLEKAPEFDGHTPDDVLNRIKSLYKGYA